jgi:hypothetical protein
MLDAPLVGIVIVVVPNWFEIAGGDYAVKSAAIYQCPIGILGYKLANGAELGEVDGHRRWPPLYTV